MSPRKASHSVYDAESTILSVYEPFARPIKNLNFKYAKITRCEAEKIFDLFTPHSLFYIY